MGAGVVDAKIGLRGLLPSLIFSWFVGALHVLQPLLEYLQASPLALFGLVVILLLCGIGLPLPEDIVLITAGLLAGSKGHSCIAASVVMYAGVVAGDSLAFTVGRHFGMRVLAFRWTLRVFSLEKQRLIQKLFTRYGSFVFFVARFLPGLRAGIFCMAGALKASYARFLFFDGVAAVISVPLWVWFGHLLWAKFGDNIGKLTRAVSVAHSYTVLATLSLGAILSLAGWLLWRRLKVTG